MKNPDGIWLAAALLVGAAILAVALFGDQGWREIRRLRVEGRQLEADVGRLQEERRRLEKEILDLRENPRAIEDRARRDLGMIREGETVFLLPERHDRDP